MTRSSAAIQTGRRHENPANSIKQGKIRASRSDPNILLFYKIQSPGRWICAVTKKLNDDGFLITAYPTDTIKEGKQIWLK
jgi:hypothetical protein